MSKSLKWILLIVAILVVVFLVFRTKGGGAKIEIVATEKATKRTIIRKQKLK